MTVTPILNTNKWSLLMVDNIYHRHPVVFILDPNKEADAVASEILITNLHSHQLLETNELNSSYEIKEFPQEKDRGLADKGLDFESAEQSADLTILNLTNQYGRRFRIEYSDNDKQWRFNSSAEKLNSTRQP